MYTMYLNPGIRGLFQRITCIMTTKTEVNLPLQLSALSAQHLPMNPSLMFSRSHAVFLPLYCFCKTDRFCIPESLNQQIFMRETAILQLMVCPGGCGGTHVTSHSKMHFNLVFYFSACECRSRCRCTKNTWNLMGPLGGNTQEQLGQFSGHCSEHWLLSVPNTSDGLNTEHNRHYTVLTDFQCPS